MLRIDKTTKALIALERKTMRESGYWERRDIQEMICKAPDAFCKELGESIRFIGNEVRPAEFVADRIDLLGVDTDGTTVIIELKRDSHKLHLLQTLAYAGMVAKWDSKRFVEELCQFNKSRQTFDQAKEELEDFLDEGDLEAINRTQRVVLLAEEFDYQVLITAEWLTEHYDMDVRCYRLALATNGNEDFLTCTRAYPPPEITDIAIRRRRTTAVGGDEANSWDELVSSIDNAAEADFVRSELNANRESRLKRKTLFYRIAGRRCYRLVTRRRFAYVVQYGRFDGDEMFWKERLGPNAQIEPRHGGRDLRFRLWTEKDFESFKAAWGGTIPQRTFVAASDDEAEDSDDEPSTD